MGGSIHRFPMYGQRACARIRKASSCRGSRPACLRLRSRATVDWEPRQARKGATVPALSVRHGAAGAVGTEGASVLVSPLLKRRLPEILLVAITLAAWGFSVL